MIPLEKVKSIIEKHSKLEIELSSTNIDKKKFAEMSKEYSDLSSIIDEAKFYNSFQDEKKELEKIINDSASDDDMKELAKSELSSLISKSEKVEKEGWKICGACLASTLHGAACPARRNVGVDSRGFCVRAKAHRVWCPIGVEFRV
mgnify:CR=1 FL=1